MISASYMGSHKAAFVHSEISFPLTPALSLGERENRSPAVGESSATN